MATCERKESSQVTGFIEYEGNALEGETQNQSSSRAQVKTCAQRSKGSLNGLRKIGSRVEYVKCKVSSRWRRVCVLS